MQRVGSRRVGFSPDINDKYPTMPLRPSYSTRQRTNTTRQSKNHKQLRSNGGRSVSSPPSRLFQYVRNSIARAVRLVSKRRRPSAKGSSNVVVPQQFVPHRDSHHSEALDDCIEFINSSYRKSI